MNQKKKNYLIVVLIDRIIMRWYDSLIIVPTTEMSILCFKGDFSSIS